MQRYGLQRPPADRMSAATLLAESESKWGSPGDHRAFARSSPDEPHFCAGAESKEDASWHMKSRYWNYHEKPGWSS